MAGARNLLQLAAEAMELYNSGRREEALARAEELAVERTSALAFHLLGYLHDKEAVRAREQSRPAEAEEHLSRARDAIHAAMGLAPRCVKIATFLGHLMADSDMYVMAELQLRRAKDMGDPIDDPADHDVRYHLHLHPEDSTGTAKERIARVRKLATDRYDHHLKEHKQKRGALKKVVMSVLDACEEKGSANLLERTERIAERFRGLGRAQLLAGHMEVEHARGLASLTGRRRCLRRALAFVQPAAQRSPESLVIALFHAKILFVLGDYDAAESECRRALDVQDPADPNEDDIPPGSVKGEEYADRVSAVKKQLNGLLLVKDYCCSMARKKQGIVEAVRVDALLQHYSKIDRSFARDISDAQSFFKEHGVWSLWICPLCDGEKFFNSGSLLRHICKIHLDEPLLNKLHSVLDLKLGDDKSEDDCSLDEITLCQDSGGHDVFHFKEMNGFFECLSRVPSSPLEAGPFAEIKEKNCREGNQIFQEIKDKLQTLPEEVYVTIGVTCIPVQREYTETCRGIQDLWLKFLKASFLDYREVILPLARSFQWRKLKKCMTEDAFFAGPNTEKADVKDIFVNVGDDQSAEELASISNYWKSADVLNKYNCHEDLLFLNAIIQVLWNLRYFREECVHRPLDCLQCVHDDPCICLAHKLLKIFSDWEENKYSSTALLLSSMKTAMCKIVNDRDLCQKVTKNIASETVAAILKGFHMSETPLHYCVFEGQELNPISCTDCICRAHDIFGFTFHVQMSCQCAKPFDEKECNTFFHKLSVGLPETKKIKSFSELSVLLDEQVCCKGTCKLCGSQNHVDHFLSNTPHFFTIVLSWLDGSKSHNAFSELLIWITSPVGINFLYKGVHSATKYSLASMIGYADGSYVCFVRYQDRWVIYDASTVKAVDSWPQLLKRYKDCKLQPEILFFEIIK